MDPVSLAAGSIAFLAPVIHTITGISHFLDGPEELQRLVLELTELSGLVHELVEATQSSELEGTSLTILHSISKEINEAQTRFEQKLSRKKRPEDVSSPFRRRTWLMQRGTIRKLTRDVVDLRARVNTCALYLLNTTSIKQLRQSSRDTLSGQPNHVLVSDRERPDSVIAIAESETTEDFLDAVSHYTESVRQSLEIETTSSHLPDWGLERSTRYFPEQYVIGDSLYSQTMVCSMIKLGETATFRVDKYTLLYAKDLRHWRRVIVRARIPSDSRLSRLSQVGTRPAGRECLLPGAVQPLLEAFLQTRKLFSTVTNIVIQLKLDETNNIVFDPNDAQVAEDFDAALAIDTSKHIQDVENQMLPQYLESEIITLCRCHDILLVLVESKLCIERKLPFTGTQSANTTQMEDFMTEWKTLLSVQSHAGVAKFVGVVLSDDRTQLQSYLVEAPGQGPLSTLMKKPTDGRPIEWERRQRWIRQILSISANLHENGISIGLNPAAYDIWVDLNDDIVITRFCSALTVALETKCKKGFLPPEHREWRTRRGSCHFDQSAGVHADLFQLGLLVWRLAENANNSMIFCRRNGCTVRPSFMCTLPSHTNPVELPLCDGNIVPDFINTIVATCRQKVPSDRSSAATLLDLLPPDFGQDQSLFITNDVYRRYHGAISFPSCDECGQLLDQAYYHCGICNEGDFDLCSRCMADGIFCFDRTHSLSRRVFKDGKLINDTSLHVYESRVQEATT